MLDFLDLILVGKVSDQNLACNNKNRIRHSLDRNGGCRNFFQ